MTVTASNNLEQLRQIARRLQAKTRRLSISKSPAPFCVALLWAFCFQNLPTMRMILNPLFGATLSWSLVGFVILNRCRPNPGTLAIDADITTALQFCRVEIKRQKAYDRSSLLWSVGPLGSTMAISALAFGSALTSAGWQTRASLRLVLVLWTATYLAMRVRGTLARRHLARELDRLETKPRT